MTDATISQGHCLALILERLIIVRRLVGWRHGMGAAMAPCTEYPTMSGCVPVEERAGVYLGNTGIVAADALRFIRPGNPGATGDGSRHVVHGAVAIGAVSIGSSMFRASIALRN